MQPHHAADDHFGPGLLQQTFRGIAWLFGWRLWIQLLSLTIGVALARLLQPGDYGLFGMATIVVGFLGMVSDFGFTTALVQRQDLRPEQLSSVFWLSAGVGLGLMGLMIALGPLVAGLYSQAVLVPLLNALSVSLLIGALRTVPNALFHRALRFDLTTKASVTASLAGGLLGIVAAMAGWGVWALVVQSLSVAILDLAAVWYLSDWRPELRFAPADLRNVWGFSLNLTGFQVMNYVARNADYFLIGRFLGPSQLGYYTLAYKLMLYPINNLTSVIQQGVFPAFARIQDESGRLANAYIRSSRYQSLIIMPAMSGLALVAWEFVVTVFNSKWEPSTPVLTLLCVVGTFQPIMSLSGTVAVARGLTALLFVWSLIVSPIVVLSFVVGLPWGIVGVAACYLVAQAGITLVGMPILLRMMAIPVDLLLRHVAVPAGATLIMVPVVWVVKQGLLQPAGASPLLVLLSSLATGALAYGFALYALRRYFWSELRADLRRIREHAIARS